MNNLTTDFPTAQEVAQHTKLKAQSVAAAVAARDKVVQDRAAASAAYNQQLLQTLDGFRGTHLDPNASHWDEMEDEDDMFGEVVEFGDGTQYKVTEVVPPAADSGSRIGNETAPSSGLSQAPNHKNRLSQDSRRPHQSTPDETDSMPPFLRARAELKSLFNERIGKFEPYPGKSNEKTNHHHPPVQLLQRQRDGPNDLPNSTHHPARLPSSTGPEMKSSNINSTPSHRPSTHQPDANNFTPPLRTILSQPFSPPKSPRVSAPPPPAPSPPAKAADNTSEVVSTQPTAPDTANQSLKYRKPDLDQVHRSEMTSAAERARKRRQEEEAARESERERAKLKAMEIEAKLKAAADAAKAAADAAKAAEDAAKASEKAAALQTSTKSNSKSDFSPKLLLRPSSRDPSRSVYASRSDSKDSWRRIPSHQTEDQLKSVIAPPQTIPLEAVVTKPETTTCPHVPLAENTSTHASSMHRPNPNTNRQSDCSDTRAPLTPQNDAFKKRNEDVVPSRPPVWKPKIASSTPSQVKAEDRQSQQQPPTPHQQSPQAISIQKRFAPSAPSTEHHWQPSSGNTSKSGSRADTRELPPHIQRHLVKGPESTPAPRLASPPPDALTPKSSSPDSRTSLPASLPSHTSPNMSTATSRSLMADKKAGFKLPDMSHLDTVMSRIKVVLEADKKARARASSVVSTLQEPSASRTTTPPVSTQPKNVSKPSQIRRGSDYQSQETSNSASSLPGQATSSPIPGQATSASTAVYIAGRPHTLLPRTIETPIIVNNSAENNAPSHSAQPATPELFSTPAAPPRIPNTPSLTPALTNPALKKPSTVRKAARFDIPITVNSKPTPVSTSTSYPPRIPKWVNRDPIVFFDATRQERPSSPRPAWKAFTVKFGPAKPKPRLPSHVIKSFWNPFVPAKVNILSWDWPMPNLSPRTLSRDDLLFRKKYIRGVVVSHVQLPKNNISNMEMKFHSVSKGSSSELPARHDGSIRGGRGRGATSVGLRGRGRGRADETTSWRRQIEEEKATSVIDVTASSDKEVASTAPTRPADSNQSTTTPSEPAKSSESPQVRRTKVKIPDGLKVAFHKPAHLLSSTATTATSGMFMVHSEITGEAAQPPQHPAPLSSQPKPSSPNRSPTQNPLPTPLTPPVATPPRSSSINCMSGSKGSSSPWTKSPLAFSVLDSHTKNVWSQPDGQITGQPPSSGKTENSLEGIADDFPATLPRTLNDFNAEEEPSSSNSHHPGPFNSPSTRKSTDLKGDGKHEQNGVQNNLQMGGTSNNPDDQPKVNGLGPHPYMNSPGNPGPMYSHHGFSSPTNFQVPPGYQLVPIGSLQTTQPTQQFPSINGIYPGQQPSGPWSPTPGPIQQPNGYARSPQLYSPNTSYPSPATSSSYPSHPSIGPSPISDGPGFNKSPGPIAPRGSRVTVPSNHQPNELSNLPPSNVHRNHPNYPTSSTKGQGTIGHSYHPSVGSLDGPSSQHPTGSMPAGAAGSGGYGDSGFGPFHPGTGLPPIVHQQPLTSFNQGVHPASGTGGHSNHLVGPHHQMHQHHHPHHQSTLVAGPPPHGVPGHYMAHGHPFHPGHPHMGTPPASLLGPNAGGPRGPVGNELHHPVISYPPSTNPTPTPPHHHHLPPHLANHNPGGLNGFNQPNRPFHAHPSPSANRHSGLINNNHVNTTTNTSTTTTTTPSSHSSHIVPASRASPIPPSNPGPFPAYGPRR